MILDHKIFKFRSSTHRQILNTQCSVTFHNLNKNEIQLIEFFEGVDLVEKDNIIRLPKSSIVIGNKIKIRNSGQGILTFRSLEFMCSNFTGVKELHIMDCSDLKKLNVVHTIFEKKMDTMTDIAEIETTFSKLYEQICHKDGEKVKRNKTNTTNVIDSRLIMISRYIRKHYNQPLTLDILAMLISCNPVYLSNIFSKVFDITPMKYLQNIRMEKAKELIVSTNLSISSVAKQTGYTTSSQFGSLFKRYYGETPYEYRVKAILNKHK